ADLAQVDISRPEAEQVVTDFRPEAIFHHAAQMDVRKSVADPVFDSIVNVSGTVRLVSAAARVGCALFSMASTGGAIYGNQDHFPADETHPTRSESPYGVSKLCGEIYLGYFHRAYGIRCVALRYGNVYGPRQDPHGEAGVVAIFAEKMLRGEAPTIFGDGGNTRDYVYVDDVVRANLAALAEPKARGAYNVGTGIETSVNVLAKSIAAAARYHGPIHHGEAKGGEQRRSVLDTHRIQDELGWKVSTSLDKGIQATVNWFAAKVHG
ncbi:MAG: NAD-dependent epimerase/dehydratase family protein, partial [Clostridia bacterium]|nr:NAD-dependent epimerase/dehydratase family protein [Deltaproteobacteria bacterium]